MKATRRRKIWQIAGAVRSALHLNAFPTTSDHLIEAIERLHGRISNAAPSATEASIRKVADNGEATFEIALDRTKPPRRQLFSLAHELGHLFVHMGFGNYERWSVTKDYTESYARSGYDDEEFDANEFAAAFLMPENEVRELIEQRKSLAAVADHFGVSQEAALVRGRWLGLYPWA